jgi:hypothetical protein
MAASNSQWLVEPYGAPSATSEVNRLPDFYRAQALSVWGGPLAQEGDAEAQPVVAEVAQAVVEAAAGVAAEPRPAL